MSHVFVKNKIQANAGILVVDSQRKMASWNRKFLQMWQIPQQVFMSQSEEKALELVSEQLKDPQHFIAEVKQLYKQVELEIHDILEFRDGKMFERFSYPLWSQSENIGRVWMFRYFDPSQIIVDLNLINSELVFDRGSLQYKPYFP